MISLLVVSLSVQAVRGEIISGRVDLLYYSIDFSTQRSTPSLDSTADLMFSWDGAGYLDGCFANTSLIGVALPLGEVCGPPASGDWSCWTRTWDAVSSAPAPVTWVVHTADGYWVKLAFIDYCYPNWDCSEILYFVQTDGTSSLCPVPVEAFTWGKIKALYD